MSEEICVVERPGDEFGNVGYLRGVWITDNEGRNYPVISGTVIVRDPIYPNMRSLIVTAPAEIKEQWPSLSMRFFIEVDGPVRWLTREELRALWETLDLEWKVPGAPTAWSAMLDTL